MQKYILNCYTFPITLLKVSSGGITHRESVERSAASARVATKYLNNATKRKKTAYLVIVEASVRVSRMRT